MRAPTLTRFPRLALLLLALALTLLACSGGSGGSGGTKLLHYQRVWPDQTEQETIYSDGRIEMKHGDTLERITISADDVKRIQDALAKPIPTGSASDSPVRTLTLADGKEIQYPVPDPGTVTELLESLLQTHKLP
ncbi:MAG: hypothetical protein U0869_06625 [Chloroflexota bacterium]